MFGIGKDSARFLDYHVVRQWESEILLVCQEGLSGG